MCDDVGEMLASLRPESYCVWLGPAWEQSHRCRQHRRSRQAVAESGERVSPLLPAICPCVL